MQGPLFYTCRWLSTASREKLQAQKVSVARVVTVVCVKIFFLFKISLSVFLFAHANKALINNLI